MCVEDVMHEICQAVNAHCCNAGAAGDLDPDDDGPAGVPAPPISTCPDSGKAPCRCCHTPSGRSEQQAQGMLRHDTTRQTEACNVWWRARCVQLHC